MNYLFSSASLRILESLSFTETLYAFDFDGTLAPIVRDPVLAQMRKETLNLFRKLAEKVPTAVISGRSLEDLSGRIDAPVRYLVGNHGLEGVPGKSSLEEMKEICRVWRTALSDALKGEHPDPGVFLEDKGLSLAIHYRNSRQKGLARNRILRALQDLQGDPRVVKGKLVFNIVPRGGPHKGIALAQLMADARAKFGFFIGDDSSDEDVFGMLDHRLMSVRVGDRRGSQAQYFIRGQAEINLLLRHLLRFHGIGSMK